MCVTRQEDNSAEERQNQSDICFLHPTEVPFSQALPEAIITNKVLWEHWKGEKHERKINSHIHFINITQTD